MFIEQFMNTGKPYLRLVKSKRVVNKNGKNMPTKVVILNIGPLSRFDDGKPDYPVTVEAFPGKSHGTLAGVFRESSRSAGKGGTRHGDTRNRGCN